MDISGEKENTPALKDVFVLEGTLKEFSTENLHDHPFHQLLRIKSGITLLVEADKKQPLFSNMTAFIPAGIPHRSIVLGGNVAYKSIYLEKSMLPGLSGQIVIFDMSELGIALFNRIDNGGSADTISGKCLELLFKLVEDEIHLKSNVTRIPIPENPDNLKITDFIEKNFDQKLKLSDFSDVLNYSERHISRIFKADLNLSIFEYLKLYRIFQAGLKLCGPHPETITHIGFSCGYDSLSSFYKDFKDIFSMSPRMFRARQR